MADTKSRIYLFVQENRGPVVWSGLVSHTCTHGGPIFRAAMEVSVFEPFSQS